MLIAPSADRIKCCLKRTETLVGTQVWREQLLQLEVVVKAGKRKKSEAPDLRRVEGSVFVKDTNENFAGKVPNTAESGAQPVNPGVGVPATGQATHE